MAITFKKIATIEVASGGVAAIEFTSIPATYDDLVVLYSLRSTSTTANSNVVLSFNGSLNNYTERLFYGNGSNVGTAGQSASGFQFFYSDRATDTSNTFSNGHIYISNYRLAQTKAVVIDGAVENNSTTANTSISAGVWADNSVITSLKLDPEVGDLVQYSSASLYGILKGSGGATVA